MIKVNPYLNFQGNTEEAFNFYREVFGGEFLMLQRFRDTPDFEKLPARDHDKIMHVSLPLGQGNILMGTDSLESMNQKLHKGNNFYICISTESEAEADKVFNALSTDAKVEMELQRTFWGAYFGMLTDKFGVQWMVDHSSEEQDRDQI
ncbi:VOC family protein [Antarcticibacterium flavum]|uniref:VOC family protein n=1 Tax=Antarcticibacterium flavum TaxID=2058175 RepID=A0A5B7X0J2_9FLAO|nr:MULTISPECIES: VOC family protein [Antarcticibacterium]MCM4158922.1 VOC family protein [Antarcticibacterium sp. W02-3]QCY68178.1 VOC family protein [Antarcticibacterium flavum]